MKLTPAENKARELMQDLEVLSKKFTKDMRQDLEGAVFYQKICEVGYWGTKALVSSEDNENNESNETVQ